MIISLCVTLAAVHAVRIQHISHNDVREFEAEVIYSGNRPNAAVTLSHGSTTVLQIRPPDAQDTQFAFPVYNPASKEHLQKAKVAMAAAITDRYQGWRESEMDFEAVLVAAITGIIKEAKAVAKADHNNEFHEGYYIAVKAEAAATAAIEAADEAVTKAGQKAKMSAGPMVLKKLLELENIELGQGPAVEQLLDDMEKRVKTYVAQVAELSARYLGDPGTELFLEEMQLIGDQVRAMKAQAFDGEVMTKVSLWLFRKMLELLEFDYVTTHKGASIPRSLQQDEPPEMSNKMKSEVGLFGFLKHISEIEKKLNLSKGQIRTEGSVKAV